MATPSGPAQDTKATANANPPANAYYGYLFTKAKPTPTPTPVLDALLRAIALHIVRRNPPCLPAHMLTLSLDQ